MIPVGEAQARLLAMARPLPAVRVALAEAAGRYAAEDVVSLRRHPVADLSAMDGYAMRFAERPGPWMLIGESTPGRLFPRPLGPREAARIFTGAPLPAGADTVLVQEEAARDGDRVAITGEGPRRIGANVRREGSGFGLGDRLVAAGDRLTPARIALAAMGGHGMLAVGGRPRVALLSTGDELVAAGEAAEELALPSSNAPMLAAMVASEADVSDHGIVPDDADLLTEALAAAAQEADLVVTTGGASVGDHDLVRPCLERAGGSVEFWRVALKPGKPLLAGRLGGALVLGLPGNPVSAHVTATLFLLPLVHRLAGAGDPLPRVGSGRLAAGLPGTAARAEYLRAVMSDDALLALTDQDSAGLVALAQATHLIVRPPHAPPARAGDSAETLAIA